MGWQVSLPCSKFWLTDEHTLFSGGEPGRTGLNLLIKPDGRIVNLGGKTAIDVQTGVKSVDLLKIRLS
jgi:hypothetical protein